MQLILDIENTVIDSLFSCSFMEENCRKIGEFIKKYDPRFVHLFTWGWKTRNDADIAITDRIYERLGVDRFTRGLLYTKNDSVDYAISRGWLNEEDREEVLNPGMMGVYGLTKVNLVVEQFVNNDLSKYTGGEYIIIDDLVSEKEHNTRPYHNILLLNPFKELIINKNKFGY